MTMEFTEIDMLIYSGQLRAYLADRFAAEVLTAYDRTFGDVQELSVEYDILEVICNRLIDADRDSRMKFWENLNAPTARIDQDVNQDINRHKDCIAKRMWRAVTRIFAGLKRSLCRNK